MKDVYWGPVQETAIKDFVTTEDIELRHQLYEDVIQAAFMKLIENIYYTFSFNKTLPNFKQEQQELIVFLYNKITYFKPELGKKSFSYFGTIVKRWFIQKATKAKRTVHLGDQLRDLSTYHISCSHFEQENLNTENRNFITHLAEKFNLEETHLANEFTQEDLAVCRIITALLESYNRIDIYNKKQLYVYLREATGLPARKITKSLVKMKAIYSQVKEEDE